MVRATKELFLLIPLRLSHVSCHNKWWHPLDVPPALAYAWAASLKHLFDGILLTNLIFLEIYQINKQKRSWTMLPNIYIYTYVFKYNPPRAEPCTGH